jgi:hypothetical protein
MHFPVVVMRTREFSRLSRVFSLGVDLRQREVAKHESKTLTKMLLHSFDDGIGETTSRTLIVPVFDERHVSVRIALNVIGGCDRNLQD